jgi:hypothetical protein
VVASSKAWVCGRLLAGVAGSKPAGGIDVCLLVNVVCCQVEVSAMGPSVFQRNITECGVCECDRDALTMRTSRGKIKTNSSTKFATFEYLCVL